MNFKDRYASDDNLNLYTELFKQYIESELKQGNYLTPELLIEKLQYTPANIAHDHYLSHIKDFPSWAKQPTKPSYTFDEVGADKVGSAHKALSDANEYSDNRLNIANGRIDNLIGNAPEHLNTIYELAEVMVSAQQNMVDLEYQLSRKADDVDGKGFSENDLTDELKGMYDESYSHTKVSHARSDATITESSQTNGNLKINKGEVAVYKHPDIHDAAMIIQDSERRFISDTERTNWNEKETPNGAQSKSARALTDAKSYVDTKINELNTGLVWKPAVPTFADISLTYPEPLDGWTVNAMDDDITYKYDGKTWIKASANAIPIATEEVDGKIHHDSQRKLNNIAEGATKTTSSTINGNLKINGVETNVYIHPSGTNPHGTTKNDVGLGNLPNVTTNDQTPTYVPSSTLSTLNSGEKLSVSFGKIMRSISDFINHIADKVSHITSTERFSWNTSYSHSISEHSPINAEQNKIVKIQRNGVDIPIGVDRIVNVVVPTNISDLPNDNNYITNSDSRLTNSRPASDVSSWAKQPTKPSYNPVEVGVINEIPISGQVPMFNGTTGLINSSGYTIGASVPSGAKFTDTIYGLASSSSNGLLSTSEYTKLSRFTDANAQYLAGVTSPIQNQLNGKVNTSGTYANLSVGNATNSIYSDMINAVYTGNGGSQPPSYIPKGKVRWNMMNSVTGAGNFDGYCDCMIMDTYTGSDVPVATGIGILRNASSARGYIFCGTQGGSTWSKIAELITTANISSYIPSTSTVIKTIRKLFTSGASTVNFSEIFNTALYTLDSAVISGIFDSAGIGADCVYSLSVNSTSFTVYARYTTSPSIPTKINGSFSIMCQLRSK